jgi:U3 small nucleolar RNA-associated protein 5
MHTIQGQYTNIVLGDKKDFVLGNGNLYELKNSKLKKAMKYSKSGLMRIHDNLLAIGGYDIDLIDLKSMKSIKTLSGHATQINQLVFTKDYLYSAATEDRFISQWELKTGASKAFVSDSCPLQIHANEIHLMAYLENGSIALWDIESPGERKGAIELSSPEQEDIKFLSAGLDDAYVIVVYGSELKPVFEKVAFLDDNNDIKPELVLTRFAQEDRKKKVRFVNQKPKSQPQVLTSLDVVEKELEQITVEEPSMEEQLKALIPETVVTSKKMTQTSLQQILTQSLQSGDVTLLERALSVSDKKIINATIQRMNPVHIIPLLDLIVVRLQKRPTRAHMLIEWIRACLLHHSGYLLSV